MAEPIPTREAHDLALQIIHATGGDPKRADEAAVLIDRYRAAGVEASRSLTEAARELVRQIANNNFRDSHGHDAIRLRAYSEVQRLISLPSPPATTSEGE